jgi:hypothetical protein
MDAISGEPPAKSARIVSIRIGAVSSAIWPSATAAHDGRARLRLAQPRATAEQSRRTGHDGERRTPRRIGWAWRSKKMYAARPAARPPRASRTARRPD